MYIHTETYIRTYIHTYIRTYIRTYMLIGFTMSVRSDDHLHHERTLYHRATVNVSMQKWGEDIMTGYFKVIIRYKCDPR